MPAIGDRIRRARELRVVRDDESEDAMAMSSHLRSLEAESIHILRETAASFERPVLLYSIGKDSSVLVHLARKAFFPARIPFPAMHVVDF